MKKIALILACAFVTTTMLATESKHRTELVKSRGQPEVQPLNHNTFVEFEYVGNAEIALVSAEVYATETTYPINAISNEAVTAPGIAVGDRKVRDVDLCGTGYNIHTDKRIALSEKTVKLPRGAISCSEAIY